MNNDKRRRFVDVDYYQNLLLEPYEDDQNIIRKKYSKLVKLFHPDKNVINSSIFEKINESYKVLSNQGMKFIYDSLGVNSVKEIMAKPKKLEKINNIISSSSIQQNKPLVEKYKHYLINELKEKEIYKEQSLSNAHLVFNLFGLNFIKINNSNKFSDGLSFGYKINQQIEQKPSFNKTFSYSIFQPYFLHNNYISIRNNKAITSASLFKFPFINMVILPLIDFRKGKLICPSLQIGYQRKKLLFLIDIMQKTFTINYRSEDNKQLPSKKKNNFSISFGYQKFITEFIYSNVKKTHCEIYKTSIKRGQFEIGNEISSKGNQTVALSSIISFSLNNPVLHILSLTFAFGSEFSVSFPLLVLSNFNIGSIIPFLIPSLYKLYLIYTYKRRLYKIYDSIMFNNQYYYNQIYKGEYERYIENSNNKLVILYAIVGYKKTIEKIIQSNRNYAEFSNVFDIKFALTRSIVNNQLIIRENIFEMEGIYIPQRRYKGNMAFYVKYSFEGHTRFIFKENNKSETNIPQ